jgi:23S rRNA A1618 N6-methylase RlmF
LLLHNFRLEVDLPNDRLCPPVPNRLNYLCWLSELFEFEALGPLGQLPSNSTPLLDIGVGASCVYPLLGSRMFGWNFFGSDIDRESLSWANQIVLKNHLESAVKLVLVEPSPSLQMRMWQLATQLSSKIKHSHEGEETTKTEENEREQLSHLENEPFKAAFLQVPRPPSTHPRTSALSSHQIIGDSVSTSRGPVRQFLSSLGGDSSECVQRCESSFLLDPFGREEAAPPLLRACMTNPPFYACDEQVRDSSRSQTTHSLVRSHRTQTRSAWGL